MKCIYCGNEVIQGYNFCNKCGMPLDQVQNANSMQQPITNQQPIMQVPTFQPIYTTNQKPKISTLEMVFKMFAVLSFVFWGLATIMPFAKASYLYESYSKSFKDWVDGDAIAGCVISGVAIIFVFLGLYVISIIGAVVQAYLIYNCYTQVEDIFDTIKESFNMANCEYCVGFYIMIVSVVLSIIFCGLAEFEKQRK